jgi:hypothetical protein
MANAAVEAALANKDLSTQMSAMINNLADALWANEINASH